MAYREMIKKVREYSGFSDDEAENALILFLRILAERLAPDERMDFASQLPPELQDTVVAGEIDNTGNSMSAEDMVEKIAVENNIEDSQARNIITSVWRAIKDTVSEGEIEDVEAQLPKDIVALLN